MSLFVAHQFVAYVLRTVGIVIEIRLQKIREKEHFKNHKNDEKLYQNQNPERFADGHVAKAVDVEVNDSAKQIHALVLILNSFFHKIYEKFSNVVTRSETGKYFD